MSKGSVKVDVSSEFQGIKFSDSDVINLDDWIPAGEYNPYDVRPWLFHDHGFTLCVVFASGLQDALDIAVDGGKLDTFKIRPEWEGERRDYMTSDPDESCWGAQEAGADYVDEDGGRWYWLRDPAFLGNASEPFDIEYLGWVELPNPGRSFCSQFNAWNASQ